mmetsp:Transcript_128167/g.371084  ORF Transcript_128167/g.371084 Transcript_128167/m.371084 type:complete len:362 (-) Transcript_128167:110-1195(-)
MQLAVIRIEPEVVADPLATSALPLLVRIIVRSVFNVSSLACWEMLPSPKRVVLGGFTTDWAGDLDGGTTSEWRRGCSLSRKWPADGNSPNVATPSGEHFAAPAPGDDESSVAAELSEMFNRAAAVAPKLSTSPLFVEEGHLRKSDADRFSTPFSSKPAPSWRLLSSVLQVKSSSKWRLGESNHPCASSCLDASPADGMSASTTSPRAGDKLDGSVGGWERLRCCSSQVPEGVAALASAPATSRGSPARLAAVRRAEDAGATGAVAKACRSFFGLLRLCNTSSSSSKVAGPVALRCSWRASSAWSPAGAATANLLSSSGDTFCVASGLDKSPASAFPAKRFWRSAVSDNPPRLTRSTTISSI